MQTITTQVKVNEDRTLTIQLPVDLPTGDYEIVLVLNNRSEQPAKPASLQAAQALFRQFVPEGRSLADELIQARREESLRE